jgi:hypothetical protein
MDTKVFFYSETEFFFYKLNLVPWLIELPKDLLPTAWQFNMNAYASQAETELCSYSTVPFVKGKGSPDVVYFDQLQGDIQQPNLWVAYFYPGCLLL